MIKVFAKIKKVFTVFSKPKLLKKVFSMTSSGYLYEVGWFNSFDKRMPVDKSGAPLPWVTYGFIDFISNRLSKDFELFEYGSGNSTKWYAERVKTVTSVEHDRQWFEAVKLNIPDNVNLSYQELVYGESYSKFPITCGIKFHIVIVDGRDRINCIKNAVFSLKNCGVIVLDDSERDDYLEAFNYLHSKRFKKIDFWGISPGLFYKKNTTLFYKENNCLGI